MDVCAMDTGLNRGNPDDADLLTQFRGAVMQDLTMLAVLHDAEPDQALISSLKDTGFPSGLGLKLESKIGREAMDLLADAIKALPEPVGPSMLDELACDYADIYLTHAYQASPDESVWIDEEHLEHQEPMFQVREYYRRHGLAAPNWRKRADDHLVLQLQFLAHMFAPEKAEDGLREAARFMDEHLLRWVMRFANRVASRCRTSYFAGVALLSAGYCEELRDVLIKILGEPRPTPDQIEERLKPQQKAHEIPVKFMPGMGPSW
jgi:TorA maturation chaperone TorD